MDQWRLLPGGPCSQEGSTVGLTIHVNLARCYCSHSHNSSLFLWNLIPLENSFEHNFPTEDGQNIPSSWKTDRTPQYQPRTDSH